MLQDKKIVLAITGGIAAYKCAHLTRLLIKAGANVKVIMTQSATQFITPQTLSVLSKNKVEINFFDETSQWINHVEIAEWADCILIAPLTANTLAKMANGICDSLLLAVYFSAKSKTIVAPAMDLDMYQHPTVKENLSKLVSFGNLVIPAESGELASGLQGEGRMAEPEHIVDFLTRYFITSLPLNGKCVLINAGPTYEAIDPVRFIGNRSTGKMGIALADVFNKLGANVTLILGPSPLLPKSANIKLIRVESSDEMYIETLNHYSRCDIVICSAAVADYKPEQKESKKIKKTEKEINLKLTKTKDILHELGQLKNKQCLVGFALETNNVESYAIEKLKKKNLDLIVANSAAEAGSGFGYDTNKISIFDKHNNQKHFELKSKTKVAEDIANYIINFMK